MKTTTQSAWDDLLDGCSQAIDQQASQASPQTPQTYTIRTDDPNGELFEACAIIAEETDDKALACEWYLWVEGGYFDGLSMDELWQMVNQMREAL